MLEGVLNLQDAGKLDVKGDTCNPKDHFRCTWQKSPMTTQSKSILYFVVLISLGSSALAGGKKDQYYGMTQQQFEACIQYGKAVVQGKASQTKKKGRAAYERAQADFKGHCDPKKQLSYAITHLVKKVGPGGIPVKPQDWAALDPSDDTR